MKRLIGYCRVSTERQKSSRNGLEAQRAEIIAFAQVHGYEIIDIVEESVSGKYALPLRPILRAAINKAKKLDATLVCSKLDRLGRSVSFISALMETKLKFIVAELGESITPFMLHIYCVTAEQERHAIGARTRAALQAKKIREPHWNPGNPNSLPVATKNGAKANAEQADHFAKIMKPIVAPMLQSGMSLRAVAHALNMKEITTARRGQWTAQSLSNLSARW